MTYKLSKQGHTDLVFNQSSEFIGIGLHIQDYKFLSFAVIIYINAKKTYQFVTQCKGVICHPFKTAKITVFYPHKVQKSKCALTRRAAVLINFVVYM